ncbi:hypothetical protein TUM4261_23750 [Shewanella sp. c952]|nr:hypothetical protein TUM4261_23750 [Shewanella sp. c952]
MLLLLEQPDIEPESATIIVNAIFVFEFINHALYFFWIQYITVFYQNLLDVYNSQANTW